MSRPREFDIDRALQLSMEVFWTKGFKSTSYEDLTSITGVKKQSLYGVFNDKRSLFLKALRLYREQSIGRLQEIENQETSPIEKLNAMRDLLLNGELESKGCLMVNSVLEFGTTDEQISSEAEMMQTGFKQIIERIIRSGQEQQLISNRFTSKELANYLNNSIVGLKVMEKSGSKREEIEAVLRTSFAMMLS